MLEEIVSWGIPILFYVVIGLIGAKRISRKNAHLYNELSTHLYNSEEFLKDKEV